VSDDQQAHSGRAVKPHSPVGDNPQSVNVQPRISLIEDGDLGLQGSHLQNLGSLFLAAGEPFVKIPAGEPANF
jgi:hypothetical protein